MGGEQESIKILPGHSVLYLEVPAPETALMTSYVENVCISAHTLNGGLSLY